MASKPISELIPIQYDEITGSDSFVLEHFGTARRLTESELVRWLTHTAQGHGGIASIEKTGTEGLEDTYSINLADGSSTVFVVTNGSKGDPGIQGEQGPKGDPALVDGSIIEYARSTNGLDAPLTGWDTEIPLIGSGEYLWTRSTVYFNSGEPVRIYTVSRNGVDGLGSGTVKSVDVFGEGGITVDGTEITNEGSFTVRHTNTVEANTNESLKKFSYDANGHVTSSADAVVGTDYGAKSFTVSIPSTGWSNNGVQVVSNANFRPTGFCYICSPTTDSFENYGKCQVRAGDVTTDGQITFYCKDIPAYNLTVNFVRVVGE